MKNILLTGDMGIGKTTLLYKIVERLNISVGGFKVDRTIHQVGATTNKQFYISSLLNGKDKYNIANIKGTSNHLSTKIFTESFEQAAKNILEKSLKSRDLIVLDELGIMEENANNFQKCVYEILDSNKLVLGVLKDKEGNFINNIRNREDVLVIRVTLDNRDSLLDEILSIIEKSYPNIIRKNYFSSNPKRIEWYDKALSYEKCDYPNVFIEKIYSYIDVKGKSILDIGSGTGAFTVPLSKEAKSVTALDFSINMKDYLSLKCESYGIDNIEYIISPFEDIDLEKHDIVINAFASGVTKTYFSLKKLIDITNEYAFIISHHENDIYKFGADILSQRLGRNLLTQRTKPEDNIKTMLKKLNANFDYSEVEFSFPQYFEDMDDALSFFKIYFNLSDMEMNITEDYLKETLIKIPSGYIYPENRYSRFIVIKK